MVAVADQGAARVVAEGDIFARSAKHESAVVLVRLRYTYVFAPEANVEIDYHPFQDDAGLM